jgi:hypothetical protein
MPPRPAVPTVNGALPRRRIEDTFDDPSILVFGDSRGKHFVENLFCRL